jgi:hypothetical protein
MLSIEQKKLANVQAFAVEYDLSAMNETTQITNKIEGNSIPSDALTPINLKNSYVPNVSFPVGGV